ncbi:reverse transcriptase domain-containing protein [Mucilaginibacter sp. AK015]|uniref:reverse transcriptase domain-containing protein n=1 Tax=Mucilaginibacter sp. AK015 TaxID=2723072 RepID=UPI0016167AAA|nr:reverse transcriptase domain-containing protein [Mucilaginibacter sp. AK015]MBB5394524.1 hypothetical protein [Mucilaginibacter sp. AK015]
MERSITYYINKEAQVHAERYQNYHNYLNLEYERNIKRLKRVPSKEVKVPDEWTINKKYNPFYVLRHVSQIAKSISKKIKDGTYAPMAPYKKAIPKAGGGEREISVYQLPDSAVSDKFYHDLLKKNKHRFSHFSYAYRNDRNVHFAIQDIANDIKNSERIFVAEFDFSNFFGSIKHSYIFEQMTENCFSVSSTERSVIEAFLKHSSKDGVGVPQGLSISLFLANLACWRLDRLLEEEGLRFARYADDTIIWTKDYTKICKAFDIINQFAQLTGIQINFAKSDGISLLQKEGTSSEFAKTKYHVEFLGYKISTETIGIRNKSVIKIKKQISYLLYKNLIQPIKYFPINAINLPGKDRDRDFLIAIMQIRRYLYGNLSENTLARYLNGTYNRLNFKGLMSFYPIIDNEAQMIELDKWMVSTFLNVLRKRKQILISHGRPSLDHFPFDLTSAELIKQCRAQKFGKSKGLYRIPSFLRIYKAIQIGVNSIGVEKVMNKKIGYYE